MRLEADVSNSPLDTDYGNASIEWLGPIEPRPYGYPLRFLDKQADREIALLTGALPSEVWE